MPESMNYVGMSLDLLNRIHTYLMDRPMREVEALVDDLRSCPALPPGLNPLAINQLHATMVAAAKAKATAVTPVPATPVPATPAAPEPPTTSVEPENS